MASLYKFGIYFHFKFKKIFIPNLFQKIQIFNFHFFKLFYIYTLDYEITFICENKFYFFKQFKINNKLII